MFGVIGTGGAIQDLLLEGVNIDADYSDGSGGIPVGGMADIGGLAGMNLGTISGCEISGTIIAEGADLAVGGLVGISTNATGYIQNCVSSGSVTVSGRISNGGTYINSPDVGGLIGYADKAEISAGGLIGWSYVASGTTEISDSRSTGNARAQVKAIGHNGYAYAGGLVGHAKAVSGAVDISNSYCTGDATAVALDNGLAFAGGFGGYFWPAVVEKCFSLGNADASSAGYYACGGGFVGNLRKYSGGSTDSSIADCYSTGDVYTNGTTAERSGGFAGVAINTSITRSYSTGKVTPAHSGGTYRIGRFVGSTDATTTLQNCFNDVSLNSTLNAVGFGTPAGTPADINRESMTDNDTLTTGALLSLQDSAVWVKRANESSGVWYYPELDVFYSAASDEIKAASKA